MQTLRTLGSFVSQEDNLPTLLEKVQELEKAKEDLLKKIDLASRKGRQPSPANESWLAEADAVLHDCNQIRAESQSRLRFLNPRSSLSVKKRVSEKLESIDGLLKKVETLKMTLMEEKRRPVSSNAAELPRPKTLGMEATYKLLKDSIQDGSGGVIGLCGMGGVGKSTMLSRLKAEMSSEFYVVAMVKATNKCSEEDVQSKIGRELGLEFGETEDKIERRDGIYHYLKGKTFLVIIDNVWSKLDLASIGVPVPPPSSRSKVVVSTRAARVCALMEADARIDVGCLPWKDSWELFAGEAGKDLIRSDPEITRHAMSIVRKCAGLPLALRIVGRAMAGRSTPAEWERVAGYAEGDPSRVPGMEKVFDYLRRSYAHVHDEELKRCFLHCAVFEEDAPLLKNSLAASFLWHGVLDVEEGVLQAFHKGVEMIQELALMCMLEMSTDNNGDDLVRMHRLMHNTALWIASECGQRKGNVLVRAKDAPDPGAWRDADLVSLADCGITALPVPPRCRNLTTLILANNTALESFPAGFFPSVPSLEVLDASRTSLTELPADIGASFNLRFLCLRNTKLVSLPRELGALRKLELLDISWVPLLRAVPRNVLSRLSSSLRVLNLFYGYRFWEARPAAPAERLCMEELEDLDRLRSLGITVDSRETLARLAAAEDLAAAVFSLHLSFLQGVESIGLPCPALGGNMKSMTQLAVTSSTELREILIGGGADDASCAWSLGSLQLMGLTRLQRIVVCNPLQAGKLLEKLVQVHISSCPRIEEVLDSESIVLPNLQHLYLGDLHELKSICRSMSSVPSLKTLKVKDCPKLRRLPRGVGESKSLKVIRGFREWWECLKWKDEGGMSTSLETLFRALD